MDGIITRNYISGIHGILVLDESKAVHELDLLDCTGAMSGEMGLNVSLGGYDKISIVRISDSASMRGSCCSCSEIIVAEDGNVCSYHRAGGCPSRASWRTPPSYCRGWRVKSLNRVDRVGRVDAKQGYMMKKKIDTEESIRSNGIR